jgi:hypothetical protein
MPFLFLRSSDRDREQYDEKQKSEMNSRQHRHRHSIGILHPPNSFTTKDTKVHKGEQPAGFASCTFMPFVIYGFKPLPPGFECVSLKAQIAVGALA